MSIKLFFHTLVAFCLLGQESHAQFTSDWQTFYSSDDIRIEAKTVQANISNRDQNLIVFRIENLTDEKVKTSYKQHIYRGDYCHGCTSSSGEYDFEVTLEPKQILNGEHSLKENKALCIFNTFVNIVPGMSNIPVDKIDFNNINTVKL